MVPAIPLDLPAILCLLGVAQGLLLALVLFTRKRGNRSANQSLAAIAVVISLTVGATILSYAHYNQVYPHLGRITHPLIFLGAPLLFLYVKALVSKERSGKMVVLHFVPAVLVGLYLMPFYMQTAEYKRSTLPSADWYYVRSGLVITQFLIYLVLIVVMLARYSQKVRAQGSPFEKAVRFQIRCLVVSFFALWIVGISRYAVDLFVPAFMRETALIVPLGATIVVYILAYLALRNSEVLNEEPLPEKKYDKSTLTPERSERYLKRLRDAMEREKLYTDGSLTLQKLSVKLSIPVQHLSQVVNEQLDQNILEFINMYRVEEVKRRLADASLRHLSILAIAEDVGFNSKSSFNAVFKKHTNVTPSEFRNAAVKTPSDRP